MAEPEPTHAELAAERRMRLLIQGATGIIALGAATAATFTDHLDDGTYAALLGAVFGWAFANVNVARRSGS